MTHLTLLFKTTVTCLASSFGVLIPFSLAKVHVQHSLEKGV